MIRSAFKVIFYFFVLPGLLLLACKEPAKKKPLFSLQENTGIQFANNIQNQSGFNIFSYRNFYNGGGVGIGDINNDGYADIVLTANMGPNKIYLNKKNWQFEDISVAAGFDPAKKEWSTGVVLADINKDGWLDIFICNAGYINNQKPKCQLFINNKDLTFTDKAEEFGLTNEGGYTTHAAFFDYDLDGDLDCFIINNSFIPVNTLNYANKRMLRAPDWPVADFLKGGGDRLLRNDNGKYTDVSKEAGIYGSLISFGLGVTIGDVNDDHYPDIYVSNDFFERDYLYINQRNGTFKDDLENWMQHVSHSSMGADMADINNDGFPDIFTTDMLPDDDYRLKTTTSFDNIDVLRLKQKSGFYNQYTQNTLQLNNKNGKFLETAFFSGVAASDWSWGGLIFDADNDGLSDIFVCNGIYHDVTNQDFIDFFANDIIQKMVLTGEKEKFDEIVNKMSSQPIPNKFFRNLNGLNFADEGSISGLDQPSFSNGSAYGDLDNDGDLDLIVNNVNQPAFIYRNNSRENLNNNYLALQLTGASDNIFAIGSKIKIYQKNQVIYRELIPTRGFQSSVDYKQVIGLGKEIPDSLIVIWPNKNITRVTQPPVNKLIHLNMNDAKPATDYSLQNVANWFVQDSSIFEKHIEDDFIDFYNERNIPQMLSREGPHADTADVNNDGLADVYIGGAAGQPGMLYTQTKDGFKKILQPAFQLDKAYEDVAVKFFDADNDGDADLFVGSGGNAQQPGSSLYNHRLYLNDGKGNFSISSNAFPSYTYNCSAAAVLDADADGDMDLFVAGRSTPQNYGALPECRLYINKGNATFHTVATIKPGLITDVEVVDVNGDAQKELLLTGEWMAPMILKVEEGKKLTQLQSGLEKYKGWWQTAATSDMDGDGDMDFILGNNGENFYLKPDFQNPVKLWIHDFDQNGTQDKIITRTVSQKDVPVFLKREITEQLPSLKKQNLKFEQYAKKTIQDLFAKNLIHKSVVHEINYPRSVIAINDGKGNFSIQELPAYTQLSSINAILCTDINGDKKIDLVLGGNHFHFQPQFCRLDASYGHILLNKGSKNGVVEWGYAEPSITGFEVRGEMKDILYFPRGAYGDLLILQNDNFPLLFRRKVN